MNLADDEQVRLAIQRLEETIKARVEFEKRKDRLTELGNDHALEESFENLNVNAECFWIAFIEADRFKSVNDQFGYENANVLLQNIGKILRKAAKAFPGNVQAFRAHGDEFYLLGSIEDANEMVWENIHRTLDETVRETIYKSSETLADGRSMGCSVSIGWVRKDLVPNTITYRSAIDCLEKSVSIAKIRGRNCVVAYKHEEMSSQEIFSLRADCGECGAKFSVDLKTGSNKTGKDFHCPNCWATVARPASPSSIVLASPPGPVRIPE